MAAALVRPSFQRRLIQGLERVQPAGRETDA